MYFGLTLLLFFVICGDSFEAGWKGIKPFHTSKKEVDKLLGKAGEDAYGYYRYTTPEAEFEFNYSQEPCSSAQQGRGKYNLPANTVLSYRVVLKNRPKVAQFEFDRKKFHRETSGHVLNLASYVRKDNTVSILVAIEKDTEEYVREIAYGASTEEMEKLECKEIK
jgi:hypothetical protein